MLKTIGLCILIGMITSCELITEENDECEDTKWSSPKEPTIYLKLSIAWDTVATDGMMSFISHHATTATFSGTITKIYCGGEVSSTFSFNPTFYPEAMSPDDMMNGFYLPQPYQFKFQHDEDYLQLITRIQYYFNKAEVKYESLELTQKVYYKDLHYDYNMNSYYISILVDEGMSYVQVGN